MRVDRIMSQPVITCRRTDALNEASRLMWEHDCGVLPVVDTTGTIVGIITDRDICMAAYTQGKTLRELCVETGMAKRVITVDQGADLAEAEALMSSNQVRRLPVVDGGRRPVGVLSLGDIALHVPADEGPTVEQDVTHTFAAICRPKHRALVTNL